MVFRELSNAVFRFVLRCAGVEIDGGVFKHPPAGGGKSRGPSGRGLTLAGTGGLMYLLRFFLNIFFVYRSNNTIFSVAFPPSVLRIPENFKTLAPLTFDL